MTKTELINALGILLCLDKPAMSDLAKLKSDTLDQMYESYKANALNAQRQLEIELDKARKQGITTRSDTRPRKYKRRVGQSNTS